MLVLPLALALAAPPHHAIEVRVEPESGRIDVVDTLSHLPADGAFALHQGLAPRVETKGWVLQEVGPVSGVAQGYRLVRAKKRAAEPVRLVYGGVIAHEVEQAGEEYQRSFAETVGLVSPDGVYLGGASAWVPQFEAAPLVTWHLDATVPDGWTVVEQGQGPTDDVYLIAGRWTVYDRAVGGERAFPARVLLREPDPELADRYLTATGEYLALYEGLLGPFPYRGFSAVENFWETGYGMPGFTLLGSAVLRFPWILTTSYPHELLHNWWGNSVFVDPNGGNWCEGLTAYMADHLLAERDGRGADSRRATLQKYTDFVSAEADFPLVAFRGRTSAATEAVGYGKSLMLWHMARARMGDAAFVGALRAFAAERRFQRVGFAEVGEALEARTPGMAAFVHTWATRTSAPTLELGEVAVNEAAGTWTVAVTVRQAQADDPFPLTVPVVLTTATGPQIHALALADREATLTVTLASPPLRVDVDPEFDVLRRLDPAEVPPAISTLMGDPTVTFVLPAKAPAAEQAAWRALAEGWAKPNEARIALDSAPLPDGGAWVLGWSNRHLGAVTSPAGVKGDARGLQVGGSTRAGSVVIVGRGTAVLGLVTARDPAAIPGLQRKLPHYTKYGWLAFEGTAPDNVGKGSFLPTGSPLSKVLVAGTTLVLPARRALGSSP